MADYYRDLTRLLRAAGYEFKRQGRGDHEIWWNRGRYSKGLLITVRGGHGSRPRGPRRQRHRAERDRRRIASRRACQGPRAAAGAAGQAIEVLRWQPGDRLTHLV